LILFNFQFKNKGLAQGKVVFESLKGFF
jgi:hypothetical protein